MRAVTPEVYLIARPQLNWHAIRGYLQTVDAESDLLRRASSWPDRRLPESEAETLVEFAGRLCYRSWDVGLNPNIAKTREDSGEYLANILASGHGSVLEHGQFSFVLHNVSRVFTHELVRHRVGVAISQESMRFVRLTNIPLWMPDWAREDPDVAEKTKELMETLEEFQYWAAAYFGLDEPDVPFTEKKHKTSFMRRFAPDGVATGMLWSANIRTLRWVVQARTDAGAEEEIRLVFHNIGQIMRRELPHLFADFHQVEVKGSSIPAWVPETRKV